MTFLKALGIALVIYAGLIAAVVRARPHIGGPTCSCNECIDGYDRQ